MITVTIDDREKQGNCTINLKVIGVIEFRDKSVSVNEDTWPAILTVNRTGGSAAVNVEYVVVGSIAGVDIH